MLEIQFKYTKDNTEYNLKTPKLKLIGKDMDDNESYEFVLMTDGIKVWDQGEYPNYTMFVRFADKYTNIYREAFSLVLSKQAYNTLNPMNLVKGQQFKVWKDYYTNTKTGAQLPVVRVSVTNQQQPATANTVPVNPVKTQREGYNTASAQSADKTGVLSLKTISRRIEHVIPVLLEPENYNQIKEIAQDKYRWFFEIFNNLFIDNDRMDVDKELDRLYQEFIVKFYQAS